MVSLNLNASQICDPTGITATVMAESENEALSPLVRYIRPVRLNLSALLFSHRIMFFSHNKSASTEAFFSAFQSKVLSFGHYYSPMDASDHKFLLKYI